MAIAAMGMVRGKAPALLFYYGCGFVGAFGWPLCDTGGCCTTSISQGASFVLKMADDSKEV